MARPSWSRNRGVRKMMDRMVDGDLQAKIVEAGKLNAGHEAVFLQGLPDGGDREEDHGPEIKIIANAPGLIIIQRMKDLPLLVDLIEIRNRPGLPSWTPPPTGFSPGLQARSKCVGTPLREEDISFGSRPEPG